MSQYFVDPTHPRARFRIGQKVFTTVGWQRFGTICRINDLPREEINHRTIRSIPSKANRHFPVRMDDGSITSYWPHHLKAV